MYSALALLLLASSNHARRVQTTVEQRDHPGRSSLASTLLSIRPTSVIARPGSIALRQHPALAGRSGAQARMVATIDATDTKPEKVTEINYYELDQVDAEKILDGLHSMIAASAKISEGSGSTVEKYNDMIADPAVMASLISLSRLPVFSTDFALAFKDNLELLRCLKQIKYFWSIPQSQLTILLKQIAVEIKGTASKEAAALESFQKETAEMTEQVQMLARLLPGTAGEKYIENAEYLEIADPHAVYPTSIYRQCDGLTLATKDASTIEAVMSTAITTTIKIARDVLEPSNELLYNIYKPLGRCVAVVDDKVDAEYGEKLDAYFAAHGIKFTKLVFSGNEADKDIRDVERILVALKEIGLARNEPLLVVGGGVIADIAGFATSMYSRNTPYVMLCTSIVAGIDAGPSPRVCCNGFDYKNLYGAYHPPVLTITDRGFWKSLHPGWLRHGVAEIIKMAVMKDLSLFKLMEKWGPKCLQTKFGTEGESIDDSEFQDVCDLIVGKAMEGYVRSEYGNLWETHQARPHAYGHTWCPGYELKSGMLHGQAVGTCMGYGAYLAYVKGFIPKDEMHRILKVISDCELALWHPIMEDKEAIWKSNLAIIEKRGGNLAAPVPKPLGESGYVNELTEEDLYRTVEEYKAICETYPRHGRGVDEHCVDVGLEDPQSKKVTAQGK
mmetsp:Transcript_104345/g.164646  ORF Transcript_104345/g.164646 Transcript_104345/m.164646 type:complete len:673 (+) Transcript_104345:63-2081(+)